MPTAKKQIKLRDQKPLNDPVGGRKGGRRARLNSADTAGANENRRGRRGRRHF